MTLFQISGLFLIYSILGWTLDSTYRTCAARRLKRGGFSPYPFSPVYGFAALLATAISKILTPLPLVLELLIYSFIMGAFEYISGVVVVKTFNKRLWSYSDSRWNFDGHTAPQFAVIWGVISLCIIYILNPFFLSYLK